MPVAEGARRQVFGVVGKVLPGPVELFLTPDETIPVVALPDFATAFEMFIDRMGGEALDRVYQVFESVPFPKFPDNMDMIGHDDEAI